MLEGVVVVTLTLTLVVAVVALLDQLDLVAVVAQEAME
jgi:hypothetical protein|tara:strand:- start:56 stop:169 length:114 start_codon:yes stop_codon:yes gene_type:complete